MFSVSLLACRPLGLSAIGLLALLAASEGGKAADLVYGDAPVARDYGRPQPYRGDTYYEEWPAERCRIVHRRAFDEYGREVVRRIRECDEGIVASRPLPRYGEAPRVYEAPPRYRDYDAPRPPRDLDPYAGPY